MKLRLISGVDGPTTGLSRYARDLRRALEAQGVAVELVAARRPPLPRPIVALAKRFGFDLPTFFTTYPIGLPPAPPGTITHLTSQNQASALAWRGTPAPVVTVHDIITLSRRGDPEITGYLRWYDRFFDNLAARGLKRAAFLIADSAHTRDEILRYLDWPAERVCVVYLGIDQGVFAPGAPARAFYARYGLERGRPYVVYVGSEDPRKNLHRLIDAIGRLRAELPAVQLLKVGAARFASERRRLVAHAERAGLGDAVRFFDQVPEGDLAEFYRVARVFAFPSLAEGFGLPVLEAMASGTPVVSSDATSLPELAGDAALLVDPRDPAAFAAALRRVLTEPDLPAVLRARGLRQAAQFTWERAARETLAIYREVRARHPAGREDSPAARSPGGKPSPGERDLMEVTEWPCGCATNCRWS